jgi:choline-sulfatase
MKSKANNLLVIMSDEHNPKIIGKAAHPIIETPHLDSLIDQGTYFANAYTTSPVCIPARAGFACGKYINQIGFWDNADAYDGSVPSWHHIIREKGFNVTSIGKLHFRHYQEDHGFTEEQIPMHILSGKGDLLGLVRDDLPKRGGAKKMAASAGPGESQYTFYDKEICSRAQIWLRERAVKENKPWVLYVSFVAPHFPLTAPPEHFYKYWGKDIPMPLLYAREERPKHPYLEDYRNSFCYDDYFENADQVKKALCGYFGLVSYLDENIGKILKTLNDIGLSENTNILYTSDHGDNLGARGLWGKSTMFEEVVGVPLIMAGPDVPKGIQIHDSVSHVDCFPTILESVGIDFKSVKDSHPGVSLFDIANGYKPERTVISEYHGMGTTTAAYALKNGRWKYIYYPKYPAQLFDLVDDPDEIVDLGQDSEYCHVIEECHKKLLTICDPDETDRRARSRQAKTLAANGGREAVIARGDIGFTPAPGAAADFL